MLGRTEDRQREIDKRSETGREEQREGRPGDRKEVVRQRKRRKDLTTEERGVRTERGTGRRRSSGKGSGGVRAEGRKQTG